MYATRQGLESAKRELEVLRKQMTQSAEDTADMYHNAGDNWHDNPAWYAAQQKQQLIEAQFARLKQLLESEWQFIEDLENPLDSVSVGCVVELEEGSESFELTILGPLEADADNHIVSCDSPVAQSLIGRSPGDTAVISNGTSYRLISIKPWRPSCPS